MEEDHRLQLMTHVEGEGKAFTAAAKELGLEGVVAKRKGSKYLPGRRSDTWRKIKLTNTQDCVILGWTPGQGGRSATFGALLVGALDDGDVAVDRSGRHGLHRPDARDRPGAAGSAGPATRRAIDDPSSPR